MGAGSRGGPRGRRKRALALDCAGTFLDLAERIGEAIGRAEEAAIRGDLRLRRVNRIRTIQGTLAIEGNYEFEFIHPFEDGNGRMGRLWQTLILTRWNPLFADVPVESLVHARQSEYYEAIRASSAKGESTPFIIFMLEAILGAVRDCYTTDQAGD